MAKNFTPNRAGYLAILNGDEAKRACHREAMQVAANVRQLEPRAAEVVVDDYRTDRAASSVTIKDGRSRTWAVRDGIWSRAAASAGLEVTEK